MRRSVFTLAVAMGLLLVSTAIQAAQIGLQAAIDCVQGGTCALGGSGTGTASITFNTGNSKLSWDIAWSGLSAGPAIAMHFHGPAAPGTPAGVQQDIGGISGLSSPSIGSATISAAQAADLLAGLWYINIHTDAFPGGEIRGQVVPEPATLLLLGGGLAGLAACGRRRSAV